MEKLNFRYAIVVGALLAATPVLAQDWDYSPTTPTYPLTGPEQLGDGSNAHGGTPLAASRVTPIVSNFDIVPWLTPGCDTVGAACTGYTTPGDSSGNQEAKFRTHCATAKVGWFDPILYPGQANAGHPHLFVGNTAVTKDSTYSSLRTTGDSTCGGGQINRSSYWIPCLMWGANKCLKMNFMSVYYNIPRAGDRLKYVPIPPGMTYVAGVDPADPEDLRVKAEVTALNARSGSQTYVYGGTGASWKAMNPDGSSYTQGAGAPIPNAVEQPYFRKKDGSWSMIVPAGGRLVMSVNMPTCWDGKNLKSPKARLHVRNELFVVGNGNVGWCPTGWYRIPQFLMAAYYTVTSAEIASGNLFLASDRMGASSTWTDEGKTAHNDWFGAWDPDIMSSWMANCNGIVGISGHSPSAYGNEGIDSSFCDGRKGKTQEVSPTGRNPTLDLNADWSTRGVYRFYPVVKPRGAVAMCGHGTNGSNVHCM